jgi:hypothetical protein
MADSVSPFLNEAELAACVSLRAMAFPAAICVPVVVEGPPVTGLASTLVSTAAAGVGGFTGLDCTLESTGCCAFASLPPAHMAINPTTIETLIVTFQT